MATPTFCCHRHLHRHHYHTRSSDLSSQSTTAHQLQKISILPVHDCPEYALTIIINTATATNQPCSLSLSVC
uniref:Uncharacterized protein n=1 Tax=Rhizophora mucronata TaxID=61149 RepID=A0A2P2IV67_RHIMU